MSRKRAHVDIDFHSNTAVSASQKQAVDATAAAVKKPLMKSVMSTSGSLLSLPLRIATQFENIRAMRAEKNAPVDTMGCDKLQEEHVDEKTRRYQVLLSLMLSSQTRDEVTHDAMIRLHKHGANIDSILKTPEEKLAEIIKPVGMYRKKANYIRRTTELLAQKFEYDIPSDFDGLCSLPGVGEKMALLALECGWGITAGIAVDTHVHRIANRLEWVEKPTSKPEKTRVELEKLFPKELWPEINHLLVGFGQKTCRPVGPLCGNCLNQSNCSVGKKTVKSNVSPYFQP